MKPIWYFVGLILSLMGTIIFLTGLYNLYYPESTQKVLSGMHPDVWWGALMAIIGLVYIFYNRNKKIF